MQNIALALLKHHLERPHLTQNTDLNEKEARGSLSRRARLEATLRNNKHRLVFVTAVCVVLLPGQLYYPFSRRMDQLLEHWWEERGERCPEEEELRKFAKEAVRNALAHSR